MKKRQILIIEYSRTLLKTYINRVNIQACLKEKKETNPLKIQAIY